MINRWTVALAILASCIGFDVAAEENGPQTVEQAVAWLRAKSMEMIPASRRTMQNGVAAFPPQAGSGYEAFWLRDYAYMLEGCIEAFTDKELRDACLVFINAQRADGACVDCVKFDGTPIYTPGFGRMGENPVADGSQFTVDVAWHTHRRLRDPALVKQIIDRLVKAMEVVPRSKAGLVFIDPAKPWDRCPYGFTDTVRKTGEELFSSLLADRGRPRYGEHQPRLLGREARPVQRGHRAMPGARPLGLGAGRLSGRCLAAAIACGSQVFPDALQ
jgi:hypothetical protein